MKTKLILALCIPFVVLAAGCEEDNLKLYDGPSSVYFRAIDPITKYYINQTAYGFGGTDLTEYIYQIPVVTSGDSVSYDREYKVAIVEEINAEKGADKDYDYPDRLVIPGGETRTTLPVTLYRGDDGDERMKKIKFQLVPNDNFTTDMRVLVHAGNPLDTVEVTHMSIEFTSQMQKPANWHTLIFGYFSIAKYILVTELNNLTTKQWANTTESPVVIVNWASTLNNYLYYRASMGHESAIKDPHWSSKRGYMIMGDGVSMVADPFGSSIPDQATTLWPDYPQTANPL